MLTVLVLDAGIGSVTPAGAAMVATLVSEAGPLAAKVPVTWIATSPRFGNVGIVPETDALLTDSAAGHAAPLVAEVQLAATSVTPGGSVSWNVARSAPPGPLLPITSV